MFFWWYMLMSVMICALAMILGGWIMWKYSAKGEPSAVGYRTKRSVASVEAWQFANEDCGRRCWRCGWVVLGAAVSAMLPVYGATEDTVGTLGGIICLVECVIMVLLIVPTERALRRKFD